MWHLTLAAMILVNCIEAQEARKIISHETHDGYFVSNKFEPDSAESFVVLTSQDAFDKVFGVARVMNDTSHRLPPDAFKTKMVVSAIHRGKATWDYTVDSLSADGTTLVVKYTAKSTPHDSAEFACPLIISLDRSDYTAVRFEENGKTIKTIALPRTP